MNYRKMKRNENSFYWTFKTNFSPLSFQAVPSLSKSFSRSTSKRPFSLRSLSSSSSIRTTPQERTVAAQMAAIAAAAQQQQQQQLHQMQFTQQLHQVRFFVFFGGKRVTNSIIRGRLHGAFFMAFSCPTNRLLQRHKNAHLKRTV
jgi:hypothetical protein